MTAPFSLPIPAAPIESSLPGAPRLALLTFDLEGGGAERVMATLANGFARAGHPVDLVCIRATGPFLRELDPAVRVVDLGARKAMLATFPLVRYLRRAQPDVLLSTLVNVNIVAAIARGLAGVPLRFVARETTHASADDQTSRARSYGPVPLLRRWAYRQADQVLAPSRGVADDLVAHVGVQRPRVTMVANPVDIDRVERLAGEATPHLDGVTPATKVVISIGRLSAEKDLATLIRAFARLPDRAGAVLLLLGEGEQRPRLERLVDDLGLAGSVIMPGFVVNPFCYLKRASVFVLASRYEGMPNTLLQALAIGTPVVSTDCRSGPRELLEEGRWGRLVPVGAVDAMAGAIQDALDGKVASPPRELVASRYGLDAIVEQYRHALFG